MKLRPVLLVLQEAFEYAEDTDSDRWDFAIGMTPMREAGVTETDLRWLVKKGYVAQAREVTAEEADRRRFRPATNLTFSPDTCFVITDEGLRVAVSITASDEIRSTDASPGPNGNGQVHHRAIPFWNPQTRELTMHGRIVKRFKWQAVNQETVLSAFQEDGWPEVLDDPLPPKPEHDSKCRLHDTIKALNHNQEYAVIRFRGNGTGEGIRWQLTDAADPFCRSLPR